MHTSKSPTTITIQMLANDVEFTVTMATHNEGTVTASARIRTPETCMSVTIILLS